jgi:hypothetical protein
LAIWLADWPSFHMRLSVSTRSSVQDIATLGVFGRRSRRGGGRGVQA